jgi:hypothetical protein
MTQFNAHRWIRKLKEARLDQLNESGEVTFTLDDSDLDDKFLANKQFSRNLDYKDDGGDSLYVLPQRDFDRFMDWADSSGHDVANAINVIDGDR